MRDGVLDGLRLRDERRPLTPLRLASRSEGVRLGVREREAERGDIERRGDDRSRIGDRALAAVGVCERVRERPRSGDRDAMAEAGKL